MFQAIQLDPTFTKKIGQIVLLGGAFAIDGNVNPAAETNVSPSFFFWKLNTNKYTKQYKKFYS